MLNIFQFFFPKTIHQENSPINGKIKIVEQFGKRSIKVGGMEQSGPIIEKLWEKGVKETQNLRVKTQNCLILGLGGGSAVKVVNKYFPQAKILGVEIDPVMVKLGEKYLGLSECHNLEIKIGDAFTWLEGLRLNASNHLARFDLILIDLYLGRKVAQGMESEKFLTKVKKLLTNNGVVIFNRLRGRGEEVELKKFLDKLKKVYHDIRVVRPMINYLIICR